MDLNLVALAGRITTTPDIRELDTGARLMRLLVAVRSEAPHSRLDVVPVVWWNPDDETVNDLPTPGARVWVTGAVQRRFWEASDGPRSRIEIVASHVNLCPDETSESFMMNSLNRAC
jgi:single-stranded DNA-binding protein